jgi:nucleoside-diphosphate-sugar epimerase
MATILLTGATGTVGSSLAPLLKERGHRLICLVRGDNPVGRLEKAVGSVAGIEVLGGDIVLPGLGIGFAQMRQWRGKIDAIIHCASAIKFDEALAKEITSVNVAGTANVLAFAKFVQIPEVHYVSTAYVAGDADNFSESDLDIGQTCRNVYERTKLEAEKMVRAWKSGRHSIYRLGIVVGDTVTGCTTSFNGFYVFVSRYCELRDYCLGKIAEGECQTNEIGLEPNGMLRLPVYGNFSPISTLNMVPIDWAAKALARLAEIPATGQTYHVVHPRPPRIMWLNNFSLRRIGITGFRYEPLPAHSKSSLLERVQRVFDRGATPYIPYTTHEARFDASNLSRALRGYEPPDIDEAFIAKLLDYARSVNFGRQSKTKQEHKAVI